MKKCPNCRYLWPDEYAGQCLECGNPMKGGADQGLSFRYAAQVAEGRREHETGTRMEGSRGKARPGDVYDSARVNDHVLEAAKKMIVQRQDVEYEVE